MRVETALVLPACSAEVAAPDPHGASPCWQPESADRGGGFGLPGRAEAADGGRGLAWRLYSQRPDVLDLTELSLGCAPARTHTSTPRPSRVVPPQFQPVLHLLTQSWASVRQSITLLIVM